MYARVPAGHVVRHGRAVVLLRVQPHLGGRAMVRRLAVPPDGAGRDGEDALGRFKEAIDQGLINLEAQSGQGAPSGGAGLEDPLGLR
jgi:hypothetical protein